MRILHTLSALTVGIAVLGAGSSAQTSKPKTGKANTVKAAVTTKPLSEEEKILHALNRLAFGPRPGDVERVRKIGLKSWIEQQLHPEKIDDTAVEKKTSGFTYLKLTGSEVAEMERAVQMNNARLIRIQQQMAQRGATEGSNAIQGAVGAAQSGTQPPPNQQAQMARNIFLNATPEERKMLEEGRMAREKVNQSGAQLVMDKIVRAVESERQLYEVMVDFWSNHFNIDATKVRASKVVDEQQVIRPNVFGKFRDLLKASATSAAMMLYLDNAQSVAAEMPLGRPGLRPELPISLQQLRAAAERRQGPAQQLLTRIQQQAKEQNISEEEAFRQFTQGQRPGIQRAQRRGLNENYARELLELHTLGVDGGYTQKDVTELARCLTGWGVKGGRYSGEFEFHPALHDRGEKIVLGRVIPAGGGLEEGMAILDMLAEHPATIKHISTKICRRLVSDEPPASLIDKCAATWKRTDGDLRAVVETVVTSPEFFSRAAYKSKIKSPFEYVISAVRAAGGTVIAEPPAQGLGGFRPAALGINVFAPNGNGQTNQRLLSGQIGLLGQPLFNYGFPTGYPEDSAKWVSSGALIGRINFALALVNGRLNDVDLSNAALSDDLLNGKTVAQQVDIVAGRLLGHPVSPTTRATILRQMGTDAGAMSADAKTIASLLLGSPEFQRR